MSEKVIRIRIPDFRRLKVPLYVSIVAVISLFVLLNLFASEKETQSDLSISDPVKKYLYLNVRENMQLIHNLRANQREIHELMRDAPERLNRGEDSVYAQTTSTKSEFSILRSNSDYAGVYSGFFREIPHAWPLKLGHLGLNSGYGSRGSVFGIFGSKEFHPGFDLTANQGTPVVASADGTVKSAVVSPYGYGNHVILIHSSGYETLYGHLTSVKVKTGKEVRAGELLGYSGSTGASSGPHLHYEIRYGGKPVDPGNFLVF